MGVIGNKQIPSYHLLHHRMPAPFDVNHALCVDGRPDIMAALRNGRKGSKHIQSGNGFCGFLDPLHFPRNGISDLAEHIIL